MKKIFLLAAMICLVLTSTAFATREYQPRIGVVIIGGAEFKTNDYYKIVQKELKPMSGAKVFAGNDIQTNYKKYWLKKGYIGDQEPQKNDLIEFAATSGYSKVVYVIISDTVDDQRNSGNHRQRNRISVQLDVYLSTPTEVLDVFSANEDQKSKGSALRARRGAFQKCLREIAKTLNNHL